jgi:hypothetical protein
MSSEKTFLVMTLAPAMCSRLLLFSQPLPDSVPAALGLPLPLAMGRLAISMPSLPLAPYSRLLAAMIATVTCQGVIRPE